MHPDELHRLQGWCTRETCAHRFQVHFRRHEGNHLSRYEYQIRLPDRIPGQVRMQFRDGEQDFSFLPGADNQVRLRGENEIK